MKKSYTESERKFKRGRRRKSTVGIEVKSEGLPDTANVAVYPGLRPFEREFIRRVTQRSVSVEEAVKMLDTGPGPAITLPEILRPKVLEALLNEYAVMRARLAQSEVGWEKLVRDSKNCLSEIISDKEITPSCRVSACKAIFEVLRSADPEMLKERDLTQDFEDAVDAIVAPASGDSKAVN